MGVQIAFNYGDWIATFPELAYVKQAQAVSYFALAVTFHRNDGGGPVNDSATQSNLLNLLVAHLAVMFAAGPTGSPAPSIVGRISDATEGSVSVRAEYAGTIPTDMAWFIQTKYGAAYWQASAGFRTMRYKARPTRVVDGIYPWRRG